MSHYPNIYIIDSSGSFYETSRLKGFDLKDFGDGIAVFQGYNTGLQAFSNDNDAIEEFLKDNKNFRRAYDVDLDGGEEDGANIAKVILANKDCARKYNFTLVTDCDHQVKNWYNKGFVMKGNICFINGNEKTQQQIAKSLKLTLCSLPISVKTNPEIAKYFSEIKALKPVVIEAAVNDYRQYIINNNYSQNSSAVKAQIINTDSGFYVVKSSSEGISANKLAPELFNIWEAESIKANKVQELIYGYGEPVTSLKSNVKINDDPSIFSQKLVAKLPVSINIGEQKCLINEIKPEQYENVQSITREEADNIQKNIKYSDDVFLFKTEGVEPKFGANRWTVISERSVQELPDSKIENSGFKTFNFTPIKSVEDEKLPSPTAIDFSYVINQKKGTLKP